MKIFKFGGASVKNAEAVMNVLRILDRYKSERLIVVISAMGKTTNAIEVLLSKWFDGRDYAAELDQLNNYHTQILDELDALLPDNINRHLYSNYFQNFSQILTQKPNLEFDQHYDQIVAFGEYFSTSILSAAAEAQGKLCAFHDVRKSIKTNSRFRSATVNWDESKASSSELAELSALNAIVITQGFIGQDKNLNTTTLGREGSDYTAAVLAYLFDAESVTIWKDVPGMLNADPRYFPEAIKLERISYLEAIELSYYGASVIHPKTIQPLQNKGIPLYVKSFLHPEESGSIIQEDQSQDKEIPSFIIKQNQYLVSISTRDFSFIVEEHLSEIFDALVRHGIKINVMQNSAISFSFCIDEEERKFNLFREEIQKTYSLKYNTGLSLLTIRHYTEPIVQKLITGKEVFLEQRSRTTMRIVMR